MLTPSPTEPLLNRAFDLIDTDAPVETLVYDLRDLLGFDHIVYTTALSTVDPTIKPLVRTTFPADWLKRYVEKSYEDVDPVLKRGYASALPFRWSEVDIRGADTASMMGDAVRHGIGPNGFSIPIVSKTGRRGLFSITGADPAIAWNAFFASNVTSLTQVAHRLHKQITTKISSEGDLHLSGREIECLAWCARGKEAGDIAVILGLSIHTVREYLKSARFKLDCSNLPQAVAKAITRGLISAT